MAVIQGAEAAAAAAVVAEDIVSKLSDSSEQISIYNLD